MQTCDEYLRCMCTPLLSQETSVVSFISHSSIPVPSSSKMLRIPWSHHFPIFAGFLSLFFLSKCKCDHKEVFILIPKMDNGGKNVMLIQFSSRTVLNQGINTFLRWPSSRKPYEHTHIYTWKRPAVFGSWF